MSRNSILALLLISGVIVLFNSPVYYKLRGKPYPYAKTSVAKPPASDSSISIAAPPVTPDSSASDLPSRGPRTAASPARVADGDSISAQPEAPASPPAGQRADTVVIETARVRVAISTRGATVVSVRMKDYRYHKSVRPKGQDSLIELVPGGRGVGLGLSVDLETLDSTEFGVVGGPGRRDVAAGDSATVVLIARFPKGGEVRKEYTFYGDGYVFGYAVRSPRLNGRNVRTSWSCGIAESESAPGGKPLQYDRRKAHLYGSGEVQHFELKEGKGDDCSGEYQWAGTSSKYFLVALISAQPQESDFSVRAFLDSADAGVKNANPDYALELRHTAEGGVERYRIYGGPMQVDRLRAEGVKLEKVLFRGWAMFLMADKWFPPICEFLLGALLLLYRLVGDYGLAIVLLTIIVKAVTYPLSVSSMRSMSKMKVLQPKITALRNRFKSDPRKMNEELMALYKKEGVNPFNPGCLPMLLQMPVLFGLFVVLRKSIELRGSATWLVPWVGDLSQAEALFRLPSALPYYGDNFAIMPFIMAAVTFVQNKMTIKDPNQKFLVYFMPVFMLVLFNSFPAGLVLYWTLSSALGLGQQVLIERGLKKTAAASAPAEEPAVRHHRGRHRR